MDSTAGTLSLHINNELVDTISGVGTLPIHTGGNIAQYIQLLNDGSDSYLSVDTNGGGNSFVDIAILDGLTNIDAASLLSSGNLIA